MYTCVGTLSAIYERVTERKLRHKTGKLLLRHVVSNLDWKKGMVVATTAMEERRHNEDE